MRICIACKTFLILCSVLSATCSMARADLITFERGHVYNNPLIDGLASGSITRLGLTATFTANVGFLNATTDNFGINAPGSEDKSDLLDSGSGVDEFITVTFNQPVEFTQLTLSSFSGSERASLTIGLNTALILDATTAGTDVYNFTGGDFALGNRLALGQTLIIGYAFGSIADNGFSLEGFQVNTVPEPSCLSIGLPVLAGLLLRRKRKA